jgi:TolB-like protein/Tfp pilus assembly protein PilF
MGNFPARFTSFLRDLKRRRVFRLAAFYLAGAWTVVVIVATLIPLGLSPVIGRWIALGLTAGFPVALVLSWHFDLTAKGIVRSARRPDLRSLLAQEDRIGIAVLPLLDLSEGGDAGHLADGIAEEVLNALARVDGLRVAARTSSFAYRGRDRDVRRIGEKLGVDYVLEGGVRRAGDRIRVRAQLVRVEDACHVLSEMYERDLDDVFGVQVDVARAIATALERRLTVSELVPVRAPAPEAYAAYLEGLHHVASRTPDALAQAKRHFERAIESDAAFAPAHAALAEAVALLGDAGALPARAAYSRAKASARRAIELDETLAASHAVLGFARTLDWDWTGVERHYERALELDPDHARARHWFALHLTAAGRLDDAITQAEVALELDPGSLAVAGVLAALHYYARQPDRALALTAQVLGESPRNVHAQLTAGLAHAQRGAFAEARDTLRAAMLHAGGAQAVLITALGHVHASAGDDGEARSALARLEALAAEAPVSPFCRASLHAALGDHDAALHWLERGRAERDGWMLAVRVHPWLDPVRGEPRFTDLLRNMGWAVSPGDVIAA